MSEKLYALFLRLYPSQFRREFAEEALQLFRDRLRDEKGFVPRLRLWLDIFFDLTISIPAEYLRPPSPRVTVSSIPPLNGVPAFEFLSESAPRPEALILGGIVSAVAVATCWLSLSNIHSAASHGYAASSSSRPSFANDSFRTNSGSSSTNSSRSIDSRHALSAADRHRILQSISQNLNQHYVDRDSAQEIAEALSTAERRGDYDAIADPVAFAAQLTRQMRAVSRDSRLSFDYFQNPVLAPPPVAESSAALSVIRDAMKRENCTFEKVELLPRNIGYLKFNFFPDPEICRVSFMAALAYVNHADAVIFDLRDNRGGDPAMVQFVGSYLFDHPEYWYNPREATTAKSWTQSPIPGNNLADKPVYILASSRTSSGAEQFCYDLKMLKRAVIIGETTAGAAHSSVFHRIDDHFGMGIPEVRAINPYSDNDWAELGVAPDLKVPHASALDAAIRLARAKISLK